MEKIVGGDCHLCLFDHAMEKIDQTALINDLLFQLVYIYTVSKTQCLHVQYVDHINRMYVQYSSLTAATHERLMGTHQLLMSARKSTCK